MAESPRGGGLWLCGLLGRRRCLGRDDRQGRRVSIVGARQQQEGETHPRKGLFIGESELSLQRSDRCAHRQTRQKKPAMIGGKTGLVVRSHNALHASGDDSVRQRDIGCILDGRNTAPRQHLERLFKCTARKSRVLTHSAEWSWSSSQGSTQMLLRTSKWR
ncbi:hypothetical protein PSPO01_01171 [Paraphaeosphaeria sporulosa]